MKTINNLSLKVARGSELRREEKRRSTWRSWNQRKAQYKKRQLYICGGAQAPSEELYNPRKLQVGPDMTSELVVNGSTSHAWDGRDILAHILLPLKVELRSKVKTAGKPFRAIEEALYMQKKKKKKTALFTYRLSLRPVNGRCLCGKPIDT